MSIGEVEKSRFPRDPFEYDYSNHFQSDVLEEQKRNMTMKMAHNSIRTGDLKEGNGNADAEFKSDYHGISVFILVGYNEKTDTPVVITGWPQVHDPVQAVNSEFWTEVEVREIHQFNGGDSLEDDFKF